MAKIRFADRFTIFVFIPLFLVVEFAQTPSKRVRAHQKLDPPPTLTIGVDYH